METGRAPAASATQFWMPLGEVRVAAERVVDNDDVPGWPFMYNWHQEFPGFFFIQEETRGDPMAARTGIFAAQTSRVWRGRTWRFVLLLFMLVMAMGYVQTCLAF